MEKSIMRRTLGLVASLLIAITALSSCGGTSMTPEEALNYFAQQNRDGTLSDYRLRIYYMAPAVMRSWSRPVRSVNDLIRRGHEYSVIVSGEGLHRPWPLDSDLLHRIEAVELVPVENKSDIRARIYYVFETDRGRKIFDVVMFGDNWGVGVNWTVFVNGIEFEWDDIFYDIIRPHLPLDAATDMDNLIEARNEFQNR